MNNWIFGYGPMPALNLEKYILPIFSLSAVIICFFLQMFIQVRTSGQLPVEKNFEVNVFLLEILDEEIFDRRRVQ